MITGGVKIAVISDSHTGVGYRRDGHCATVLQGVLPRRPDIVILAGDVTDAGTDNPRAVYADWANGLEQLTARMVLATPGNHDFSSFPDFFPDPDGASRCREANCGTYHVKEGALHLIVLNGVPGHKPSDDSASIMSATHEWLQGELQAVPDGEVSARN
jgi:3',5'-cyclic AMP phosphodiesterase CpdA